MKWSFKYNCCIKCGTTKIKHKGRGLCLSCYEKERNKTPKRKKLNIAKKKRYYLKNKNNPEFIKKGIEHSKKYYYKHQDFFYLYRKTKYRQKKGLSCMEFIVKGKTRYLPFDTFGKPKTKEWKEKNKQFKIIKDYYERTRLPNKGTKLS